MMPRVILLTAIVGNVAAAFGAAAHMLSVDDITLAPTALMFFCLAAAFICGCALEDFEARNGLVDQVDTSFHSEGG
jgi:hypothetical protein